MTTNDQESKVVLLGMINPAKIIALLLIRTYQKTLSPDHGPLKHLFPNGYCRFHPSCSEYGHQAIKHHGVIKGGAKASWRVIRCNPWSAGGIDEVK